ncbi:DUF4112 domain-containing protein [Psychromarinibacter sp. S121]|uniref:DUF4112 domain-containing protein n=1 Tax=Psychromarinibacter sp. S121 TaxID=3415127 RepID=UPI003C7B02D8
MTTETTNIHTAAAAGPMPARDLTRELDGLEAIAHRMDTLFRVPVVGVRVGLDSILGLIPGIGDTAALAPAAYILYRAHEMGAPKHMLARMGVNVGLDWLIGLVPLVGDLADIGFKANRRNVAMLRRHFAA